MQFKLLDNSDDNLMRLYFFAYRLENETNRIEKGDRNKYYISDEKASPNGFTLFHVAIFNADVSQIKNLLADSEILMVGMRMGSHLLNWQSI